MVRDAPVMVRCEGRPSRLRPRTTALLTMRRRFLILRRAVLRPAALILRAPPDLIRGSVSKDGRPAQDKGLSRRMRPLGLNQRQLLEAGPYGAGLAAEACGDRVHRLAFIMAALEVFLLGFRPRGIGVAMGLFHCGPLVTLGVARTPGLAGQGRLAWLGARAPRGPERPP